MQNECFQKAVALIIAMVILFVPSMGLADTLTLPDGIEIIEADAFSGDSSLVTVVLPESLQEIGARAFANCNSLTEINIPANVTDIADNAFEESPNVVATVTAGSIAEAYCDENGLDYVSKADTSGQGSPSDASYFNGHRYKIYDMAMTWTAANSYCDSLGGHLLTVTSAEENNYIVNLLNSISSPRNCYWIGLYRDGESTKDWKWVTGESISYKNWASNEPNNFAGNNEKYVHLFGKKYTDGSGIKYVGNWNDAYDDGASYASNYYSLNYFGFICEWDAYFLQWSDGTTAAKKVNCECVAASEELSFRTNADWYAAAPDWITLSAYEGHPDGQSKDYAITATIQVNTTDQERKGRISIYADECGFLVLEVVQQPKVPMELTFGEAELIDYKTSKVDITLTIPKSANENAQYLSNPSVLIDFPSGITSWYFQGNEGDFAVSSEDGKCKLSFSSLSNTYGSRTVTCVVTYDITQDKEKYFMETIAGYIYTNRVTHDVAFPAGIADKSENDVEKLYLQTLKANDSNPLSNETVRAVVYYELTEWFADSVEISQVAWLAPTVLEYLDAAPQLYRDLYLYSLFEYNRVITTDATNSLAFNPNGNCIQCSVNNFVQSDSFIVSLFHEAGHAIDYNTRTFGQNYYTVLTSGCKDIIENQCIKLIEEKAKDICPELQIGDVGLVIDTLLKSKETYTSYVIEWNDDVQTTKYVISTNEINDGLAMYYVKLIEQYGEYIYKIASENDFANCRDAYMLGDVIASITDAKIIPRDSHYAHPATTSEQSKNGNYKGRWYNDGKWTGNGCSEVWAEFYASQMISGKFPQAFLVNNRECPLICSYFISNVAPHMLNQRK